MESSKDQRLWRMAKKRAGFKRSLYSFLVICAFLWGIWWITQGRHHTRAAYPWPIWVMLGWGVALGFQYYSAYNGNRTDMAEEEYERLKREREL